MGKIALWNVKELTIIFIDTHPYYSHLIPTSIHFFLSQYLPINFPLFIVIAISLFSTFDLLFELGAWVLHYFYHT